MSLTKEAIEKIASMAHEPKEIKIDGRTYTTQQIHTVTQPIVTDAIEVHTLQGIVDYFRDNIDSLKSAELAIHIESPTKVKLISKLQGEWFQRNIYIEALYKNEGHRFGRAMEKEDFIVSLLAKFQKTPERDNLLHCIARIKKEDSSVTDDDGVSQSVTVKAGVSLVTEETIKNPISLRPIRTFTEIKKQPAGDYVFRMSDKRGVELTLHDANGDDWKVKAIEEIRDFFHEEIVEKLSTNISILG